MAMPRTFGTVYLDGDAVREGKAYRAVQEIKIGSTQNLKPIRWLQQGPLYIAETVVLSGISFLDLDNQGYADERTVYIDDVAFRCRHPKMADGTGAPGEWLDLAKWAGIVENREARDCWFWGQGNFLVPDIRPLSHLRDPKLCTRLHLPATNDDNGRPVGWRPILEPVGIELTTNLIGTRIVVWSGEHALCGKLIDMTEYDLVLDNVLSWPLIEEPSQRFFKPLKERRFVVNKQALTLTHRWVRGMLET